MVTQANEIKLELEKKHVQEGSASYKAITVNYRMFFEQLEKYKELSFEELSDKKC